MKVLYFTPRSPYPSYKGDQLIANQQIKLLKTKNVKVYLVSFVKDEREELELKKALSSYCEEIFTIKLGKLTKMINLVKTVFNFKPLQVNLYTNRLLKAKVTKYFEQIDPDIIHVQTIRLADYFKDTIKPKTVDMIDALSLNMSRRARKEFFFWKPILYVESYLLTKYEKVVMKCYDQTILVSENDKKYLGNSNIIVNPNGTFINEEYLQQYKNIKKEKAFIFHGNMSYFPNVEAVLTFTNEIWPKIHSDYPDYKLYIVGKDPVQKVKSLHGSNNIIVTGFVEDVCEYLCKCSIGIYPLYSGTGMQNKILEALGAGLPVLASPLALQGIRNIGDNEVITCTSSDDFLIGIERLMNDQELRDKIAVNGQRFIFNNYSWDKNVVCLVSHWNKGLNFNNLE